MRSASTHVLQYGTHIMMSPHAAGTDVVETVYDTQYRERNIVRAHFQTNPARASSPYLRDTLENAFMCPCWGREQN